MEYTWKNIVAYKVLRCKLCGAITDKDGVGRHMHSNHNLRYVEVGCDGTVYSPDFEYGRDIAKLQQFIIG